MHVPNWDPSLGCSVLYSVQDWELETLTTFMDLIYSTSMKGEGPDELYWRVRVLRFVGTTFPSP